MEITATGYIYLYERGGSYSLNIRSIEVSGQGDLAIAFMKLKEKLEKEGLFDKKYKKELPVFPHKVAVVTSATGAAVRDITKIIKNKNNYVDILIYPVLVQGPGAAPDISAAIDDININHKDVDVIITGRGGGSMEELWAFNEEIVARSIFNSIIPVISAVGHETDFTIADFVADLRAETPTAAAERAVPDTGILRENIEYLKDELTRNIKVIAESKKTRLELLNPETFGRDIQSRVIMDQMKIDNLIDGMKDNIQSMLSDFTHRIKLAAEVLEAGNPDNILARGYSVVYDKDGNVVRDVSTLHTGDIISVKASRGTADAEIKSIREED
jgi:exodeoxyribonuclease VII large subunit